MGPLFWVVWSIVSWCSLFAIHCFLGFVCLLLAFLPTIVALMALVFELLMLAIMPLGFHLCGHGFAANMGMDLLLMWM